MVPFWKPWGRTLFLDCSLSTPSPLQRRLLHWISCPIFCHIAGAQGIKLKERSTSWKDSILLNPLLRSCGHLSNAEERACGGLQLVTGVASLVMPFIPLSQNLSPQACLGSCLQQGPSVFVLAQLPTGMAGVRLSRAVGSIILSYTVKQQHQRAKAAN